MSAVERSIAFVGLLVLVLLSSAQGQVYFFDSFTQNIGSRWVGWNPDDGTICPGCGPFLPFNSDNHPHDGDGSCARQEKAQPFWYGMLHDQTNILLAQSGNIHLSAWMFEDYNKKLPFPPGDPEFNPHDQVQGWLALMDSDQTEVFAIGVHAHKNGPLQAWSFLSWYTTTDGWNITTVPRQQGFRHLEIVAHPYTGNAGDIGFLVDGQLVGQGHRQGGGASCTGVKVTMIGIGSNPNYVPEDYISNTYEFFWYDEVQLSAEPSSACGPIRFDTDGDGDVDMDDFGAFQRCYTGSSQNLDCNRCKCFDINGDGHIDATDLGAFQLCASREGVPSDPMCDGPP